MSQGYSKFKPKRGCI